MWERLLMVQHTSRGQRTACRSWCFLLCRYHDASSGLQAWWQVPLRWIILLALLCYSRRVSTEWVFKHFSIFLMSPGVHIYIYIYFHKFPWLRSLICTSNICALQIYVYLPYRLLISQYYHKSEVRIIFSRKWNHMSTFSSPLWNTVLQWGKQPWV